MKALVFDMDGVLIKEERYWKVAQAVALEFENELTRADIRRIKNMGISSNWRMCHAFLYERGKKLEYEQVYDMCQQKYLETLPPNESILDDETARRVFNSLKNYELFVATSRPKQEAIEGVQETVLGEFFEISRVYGADDLIEKVPDKSMKTQLLGMLKLSNNFEEAYYVGDNVVDMKAAKENNMKAIGVYGSLKNEQELQSAGADLLIETIAKLPNILQ